MVSTNILFVKGLAALYPEPKNKAEWLEEQLYNFSYENSLPIEWTWPELPNINVRPFDPMISENTTK